MIRRSVLLTGLCLWCFVGGVALAGSISVPIGSTFSATDTLEVGDESNEDARQCLDALSWPRTTFAIEIVAPAISKQEDVFVTFPSPIRGSEPKFETVFLEWYQARTDAGELAVAPAVIVVHESGRKMPVGRMVAQGFRQRGIHAFLIQMPGYGERRGPAISGIKELAVRLRQGIADTRRAKDAVAALPCVLKDRIALQGTSLGGFVTSTTAGLDPSFHSVFILLAGGDVYSVVKNGEREAAKIREAIISKGESEEELKQAAWSIEPTRLAHRLNPERTWLYSGLFDQVVPIENARLLAKSAGLKGNHHFQMPADHYTGILLLPGILDQMSAEILEIPVDQVNSPLKASVQKRN